MSVWAVQDIVVHSICCTLLALSLCQVWIYGSIAPSNGLELAENYIRWPRPTAEQGQLQASQAKIRLFVSYVLIFTDDARGNLFFRQPNQKSNLDTFVSSEDLNSPPSLHSLECLDVVGVPSHVGGQHAGDEDSDNLEKDDGTTHTHDQLHILHDEVFEPEKASIRVNLGLRISFRLDQNALATVGGFCDAATVRNIRF